MRALLRRFGGVSPAGLALVTALLLAGCAQYQATSRSEALPLVVEPPSQALPATTPAAQPRSKIGPTKDAGTKTTATKQAPTYRPAGATGDESSCTNVDACASVLKTMIADPSRAWMKRPAPPAVLINGVRLFAYRALREKLACDELAVAATEVEAAAVAFRWGIAGVSTEQADRARSLSAEVGQELHAEGVRRCGLGSRGRALG